jgi:hypothetical protein
MGVGHVHRGSADRRSDPGEYHRCRGTPWTWPRRELLIDLFHKGIYGFVTGLVADRLARPEPVWVQAR